MSKYYITNINYCIENEDCTEKEREEIVKTLPTELIVELGPYSDFDVESDLAEFISDETGWLIEGFNYREIEPEEDK